MSDSKIDDIEKALEELWGNFSIQSTHMQTTLTNFREQCKKHGALPHAIQFLKDTKDIPGEAIVVMKPNHLSLLVDDEGNLLEFS